MSFEREGRSCRPLHADVVVCGGVERVLLLAGVLKTLEKCISGVLVLGDPALLCRENEAGGRGCHQRTSRESAFLSFIVLDIRVACRNTTLSNVLRVPDLRLVEHGRLLES